MTKGVAIQRFGWRLGKEWMCQHVLDRGLVDRAGGRGTALIILRLTAAQAQEIVDQCIAGAGIAGDEPGVAVPRGALV